jgi:hypothetical protein
VVFVDSAGIPQWSTYHGGDGNDMLTGVAVDPQGFITVSGYTSSRDFPLLNPFQRTYGGGGNDIFVSRYDSSGALVFSTYYGRDQHESGRAVCVDSAGSIYVAGSAKSNFPMWNAQYPLYNGGQSDAVVVKFNSAGHRNWATYLGGDGEETANAIVSDTRGYLYVAGWTTSGNFPVFNAIQDSVVQLQYPYQGNSY